MYGEYMYGDAAFFGLLALVALALFVLGTWLDRGWVAVVGILAACSCAAISALAVAGVWLQIAASNLFPHMM